MEISSQTTDHEAKPKCGANKRQGPGTCRNPAGFKTTHPGTGFCHLHFGNSPNHKTAAMKQIATTAVTTYGLPRDIDPRAALLEEVHRTAGHVAWLQVKVAELEDTDVTWGITEAKKSTGKDGDSLTQTAAVNVWVQLYQAERKHLIDVCKAAIAAGIEERRVKLAEEQGALMATVIRGILADLNLTAAQTALVATVVPRHLRELAT